MRRGLWLLLVLIAGAMASATPSLAATAPTKGANARYALANGCFGLRSAASNRLVTGAAGGGYAASTSAPGAATHFYLKATRLGGYMLYSQSRQVMSRNFLDQVRPAANPGPDSDWTVAVSGNSFRITLPSRNKVLAVGPGGGLTLANAGTGGASTLFAFDRASGCSPFPEVELSASGVVRKGSTPFTTVSGYLDAHMHMMAFDFLGGAAHCGRPWSPYGAPTALTDCPDHAGMGVGAVLENAISEGGPVRTHDTHGWPTFKGWPSHGSLTHEDSYYRWLERSWMAGQRVFVNLLVENKVLCEIYPLKKHDCDERNSVRRQAADIRAMEGYIDAQAGGPGKGFFRIVTTPYEARRAINKGKLAVILGIEESEPFNCQVYNDVPKCNRAQIDSGLNEAYKLGVRDMEIVNKFDNALAGVAGDNGTTGAVVNSGNRLETGHYWAMQACDGPTDEHDKESPGVYNHDENDIASGILDNFGALGAAPIYPKGAQCNARGLTELGEYTIRKMMAKHMVVDPDHLSVRARKSVMNILESKRYGGVVSSHSWSSPDVNPRIYKLGGVITPYAGDSKTFVDVWRHVAPLHRKGYYFGFGYGADMNGFGAQGGPRNGPNPVKYPFKSYDGRVTIDRQHSGSRVYDINKDGVAHYGLYPDWIQDLRMQAGNKIVRDMARGSEAYIQMWERADGVPKERCRSARGRFSSRGLGHQRLGAYWVSLLKRAGQPSARKGKVFRYCVRGRLNKRKRLAVVFNAKGRAAFIASNAAGHSTAVKHVRRHGRTRTIRISRGSTVRRLKHFHARKIGKRLYIRKGKRGVRYVYGTRGKRVRFVGVASKSVGRHRKTIKRYLKLSGVK